MAKISLDLSQFKASGIYTLEFDASESIILNTQTVRLVVGFSRKGPFNAPVYLPDKKTARTVFGDIDPFLERRGSFFHRALYTALDYGPVFGLSLMPLNNDPDLGDKVPYMSYSIATTEKNGKKVWKLYASYYNKERFWFPDQTYFLGNVNSPGSINTGKLFNIVNLGQTPTSIIVKKATVQGFDVTAREWYSAANVPSFIDEWDYISDYFIDVILVQGNWTDYQSLSVDPTWSEFFDLRGLKKEKLQEFLGAPEINTIGSFTGSIIPDLVDGNGITHSIDVIINNSIAATGIFCSIDKEALENYDPLASDASDTDYLSAVDMIGHNFADPNRANPDIIDFLSYKTTIKEELDFNLKDEFEEDSIILPMDMITTESVHKGKNFGYLDNIAVIEKPPYSENAPVMHPDLVKYVTLRNLTIPGQSLIKLNSNTYDWALVDSVSEWEDPSTGKTFLKLTYKHPQKYDEKNIIGFGFTRTNFDNSTITISLSDVPTANKLDFIEDNLPEIGQDILLENKDTKTWYYLKVLSYVVNDHTTIGSVQVINSVTFTVKSHTILKKWDTTYTEAVKQPTGYKVYFKSTYYVDLPETDINGDPWSVSPGGTKFHKLSYVLQPDKLIYVHDLIPSNDNPNHLIAYKYSKIYQYYEDGALLPGDIYYYDNDALSFYYLDYQKEVDINGVSILKIYAYDTFVDGKLERDSTAPTPSYGFNPTNNYYRIDVSTFELSSVHWGSDPGKVITIYVIADNLYDYVPVVVWDSTKTIFTVAETYGSQIQKGQYIVAEVKDTDGNSHYKLTKVSNKKRVYNEQLDGWAYEYTVNQPIQLTYSNSTWNILRYYPIDDFIKNYQLNYLDGFKINDYHLPGGLQKQQQLEKILGMLDPLNSNLIQVLKDRDIITFRYIVDTFDGGLNAFTYPKCWLTRLAKERQKCLALMNAPAIKEFIASTDPRFTDEPTKVDPKPILQTRYIADGGNQSLGPSSSFSLPDEFWGSKFSGYFAPFLTIRENGKNLNIPPAAHVSNLFVQKFINGTPYAIVAGPRRGVISEPKMVGLEYDFLQADREYIEPFGLNPIVKKKNVGFMIYGNQMAYQKTHSAFNNLHVRDLLITIEEAVEDILANYLFEFNDSSTRLEIKTIIETYLDGVRSNGGIYDFLTIMDESNNPAEIIDQNMGIVDIAIEPARGLHKFINRVTVLKTGGVSSGGFTMV